MEYVKPIDFGHDDVDGQECKDGRSRTWMLLLYPDNVEHKAVLDGKLADLDWNFAGRVHDQEGKEHHHIVVLFKDGRKNADVAADLGIDKRWLRAWDRQKKALRYLCHRDNPDRFQYSTDGIYGTIAEKAVSACSKGDQLNEAQSVQEIVALLNGVDGEISYSSFLVMVAEKGLFSVFRRMGIIAVRLLDEHNYGVRREIERAIHCETQTDEFKRIFQLIKTMPFEDLAQYLEKRNSEDPPGAF